MERFLVEVEQRAYRMALVSTGDHHNALDIVQDSMMQLVDKYSEHPAAQWPPLFYRILQNRIYDWHRGNRHRQLFQTQTDEQLGEWPDQRSGDLSEQTRQRQALIALEAAVSRLPLRQQQVFMLRVWEGMDVNDTAASLSISAGSVKTHLSRAMEFLRQSLEGLWP